MPLHPGSILKGMRYLRLLLPAVVLTVVLFVPDVAFAANANFFGPIIPEECHCPGRAPDWGCVLVVIQNGFNFLVSLGVIAFTLALAYAGFQYMASSVNAGNKEKAKEMIQNVLMGLLIMLSAWLMVDFVMKVLYNPSAGGFGPWNSILAADDTSMCLEIHNPPGFTGPDTEGEGEGETEGEGEGEGESQNQTGTGPNCPAANPSSVVAFPAAATSGDTEKALPETVENFMEMREAAAEDGIDLKVVDGYRSDAEQVQLWNQYCSSGTCSRPVAKPCSLGGTGSNHNSGRAIDINVGCQNGQTNCSTPAYNWLKENGMRWGFRNSLANDPVHWSPTGR